MEMIRWVDNPTFWGIRGYPLFNEYCLVYEANPDTATEPIGQSGQQLDFSELSFKY